MILRVRGENTTLQNPLEFNGTVVANHKEIANKLNDFYVNIGNDLAAQLPASRKTSDQYLQECKQPSYGMSIREVDETEILSIVMKLSNKSSVGPDGLSNKILKNIVKIPIILTNLTKCINKSINEKTFPNCLTLFHLGSGMTLLPGGGSKSTGPVYGLISWPRDCLVAKTCSRINILIFSIL